MPERIRLSRRKGWRLPCGAVNVARPGRWGNPFAVGGVGPEGQRIAGRAEAVGLFRAMLADADWRAEVGYPDDLSALRGKSLACWCPLDGPCHGDVLLEAANKDEGGLA